MNKHVTVYQDNKPIHDGIVVGETITHYKVFKEKIDVSANTAEWFAKDSKIIKCK